MNGRRRWYAHRQNLIWTRALTFGTALLGALVLLVPAAVAADVGPYHFTGTVWNPKPLPATPVVGHHSLTAPAPTVVKGRTPLPGYRAKAPAWPTAGTATLALTASATKPVKAGRLPVWVKLAGTAKGAHATGAHSSGAGSSVRVQVASHEQTLRASADGMLIGVGKEQAGGGSSKVQVVVDYSSLAEAYGGGFGSRLKLVRLPGCALTTPQVAACRKRTTLVSTNRVGAEQLTASVDLGTGKTSAATSAPATGHDSAVSGRATVALAVTSGSSGSQGDYGATSLNPAGSWQQTGTGAFTYAYPIDVPAAVGDDAPTVSLDYDSQSQDGETSARNSQSSWIGDGWNYQPGFIERTYRSCGSLLDGSGDKVLKGSGDQCWGGDNATISFGSASGQLVPTTSSGAPGEVKEWRLPHDDGTVVQELSGAANGLYDGIYYRVVSTDGSAAYFGADHSPTSAGTSGSMQSGTPSDASTDSAWGVPVLHPQSGDPCYSSANGKASQCDQPEGWRWNLDFVVSPTGFVQRFDYAKETNYYDLGGGQAATGADGTLTSYTRGGALTSISYGYTLDDEQADRTPAAQVAFGTVQRCQTTSSFTDCSAGNLNDTTAPHWPDVPWDLHCDSTDSTHLPSGSTSVPTNVCVTAGPSYWDTARLDTITTKVHVKDGSTDKLVPVDSYQLGQVYSDAGGTVDPVTGTTVDPADAGSLQAVMWLQSIRHTGQDTYGNGNSDLSANQVSFTGTEIDNRVNDSSPSAPPLYHPRISSIQTETGASVAVEYNQDPCAGKSLSISTADSNVNSCYPVYWAPSGASKPIADWFNNITVHQVTTSDLTIAGQYDPDAQKIPAGSEAQVSTYSYGGPAWHRDDSALTDDQYRTWDDFRGFRTVTVQSGAAPEPVTQTTTTYLQGMDGDYTSDGTRRSVTVNATVGGSTVESVTDADQLAGTALQTSTYSKAGGTVTTATVNGPFSFTGTASVARTPWTDWTQEDNPGETEPALNTLPDLTAYRLKSARTSGYALLAGGTTWRHTQTDTTYDSQGRPSTVDADGDTSVPAQENCTTTTYAAPAADNAMALTYPDQITVVSGPCGTAVGASTLLSDQRIYYDGDGTPTNLGTFGQLDQSGSSATGEVSAVRIATGYTGSTEDWQTSTTMAYDGAGRTTDTYDAAGHHTHTGFTPPWSASGGNADPSGYTTTNPVGWTTSSVLDVLRGLPTENVDAGGRTTDMTYDALGRRTAVWLPGRDKSAGKSASITYAYSINPGAVPAPGGTILHPGDPSSITTKTLREDETYATSITIYDGMLQPRQTQTTADGDSNSGRVISDTFYDSHGWPTVSYAPYSEPENFPSTTLYAANENEVPSETTTEYDGQGRTVTGTLWHQAVPQWHTAAAYPGADETDTTAPTGGRSTATFTNALGQVTSSVVKNTGSTVTLTGGQTIPSGTSLTSDSVRLAMQADGNLVLSSLASGTTIWSSGTSGNPGAFAQFGADGNLVVRTATGTTKWTTGLTATAGATFQVRNDSTAAVVSSSGATLWHQGTAGAVAAADGTTRYTYTPAGQVATIKDSAGNTWTYGYDLLGRPKTQTDPNAGTSTFDLYDTAGNLLQSTDPRGQVMSYQYDWDNRVTAEYSGAWSATPDATKEQASWAYDTLAKGYLTSSTRYVGGASGASSKAYTQAVSGYNTAYQPLGSTLTVPAADGFAAAGQSAAPASGTVTYTSTNAYTPVTGLLSTVHYAADGSLPAEDVDFGYTQQGNLDSFGGFITASNTPAYLDTTVHDPFGRVLQTNYGPTGKELATFAQYDATTGRTTQTSSMLQTSATALDVVDYRYDQSGQLTAADDLQNNTTHDTQCFASDSFQRLTAAWTDTGGITNPGSAQPGAVGGCTNASAPTTAATVGGPAPYWQTYTYDLLGDRTGMVSHDTGGNALNDTTQSIAFTGANGTTPAATPDQAGTTTASNPTSGTATWTPTYTDPAYGNKNAGNTMSRKVTTTGPISSTFTLSGGGKRCVDDAGGLTTPGNKVQVNTCNGTSAQNWTIGTDGTVKVLGMCLDTAGNATTSGTLAVIDTCNSDPTQKWVTTTAGKLASKANSSVCLTDPGASATTGTQLTIATCPSSGQTWATAATGALPPGQTQSLTYDTEGRTATATNPSGTHNDTSKYLYDTDGNLLEQTSAVDGTDKTRILYLFGGAEQITLNVTAGTFTALRDYTGPDGTTVTRSSTGSVTYQVSNAQGTATTAIDAPTTLAVTRRSYDPWGNPRGTTPTSWVAPDENHGFLGQPTDATTGLDLLGARDYDPTQGRFLTPDPVFEAGDPNQMGGYAYAGDNPASGSDPTGLMRAGGDGTSDATPDAQCYAYNGKSCSQEPKSTVHHGWHHALDVVVGAAELAAVATVVATGAVAVETCSEVALVAPDCVGAGRTAAGAVSALFGACADTGCIADGGMESPEGPTHAEDAAPKKGAEPDADSAATANTSKATHQKDSAGSADAASQQDVDKNAAKDSAPASRGEGGQSGADGDSGGGKGCSFSPDTPVLLGDGGTKPIADITVGDKVQAGDPKTGKHVGSRDVLATWINHDTDLIDIAVKSAGGKTATLHTTANHPFWDDTTHKWTPAGKLKLGDSLNTNTNHHATVAALHLTPGTANRYNLTVQQLHTYYVMAGTTPILVHNTNTGCPTSYALSLDTGAPKGSGANQAYQIRQVGSTEYHATGGGTQVWADGLDMNTSELLDAKYVGNPGRSPFVPGGKVPGFIQAKIDAKMGDEFSRYAAVINDPGNPLVGLRVITNEPGAVPYFQGLMQQYGVPGSVVLSP